MALKKRLLFFVVCLLLATSCQRKTQVEVKEDGAKIAVNIPADATAAELIQMRGVIDASLTVKAERERMAFELAQAKLRKSERQYYAALIVGGVVCGIVSVFAVACVAFLYKFGGRKS